MAGNTFLNILILSCMNITLISASSIITAKFTPEERAAIDKLLALVEAELPQGYMKDDVYLVRFLREKKLNVDEAAELLRKTLKWRSENDMDNFLAEGGNIKNLTQQLPYYIDGVDKEGRPIVIVQMGRWDFRKFILNSKRAQVTRLFTFILESFALKVREAGNGTNITQGVGIIDVDGYNLKQHGCLTCAPLYISLLKSYDVYYPGLLKSADVINAPRIFSPLLALMKHTMSATTNHILKSHGPNKKEWSKVLLKEIPEDQLTPQYGGTRVRS